MSSRPSTLIQWKRVIGTSSRKATVPLGPKKGQPRCRVYLALAVSEAKRQIPVYVHGCQEPIEQKIIKAALDLKRQGWASLEGVLPKDECEAYEDGFWDWLAGLGTGIKRDKPATWKSPAWPPSYRGIINSLEVAHQAFVWRVRKHPQLLRVFELLWGTNALLSSFDSIHAMPPGARPDQKSWLHVDQAPWRQGICCIQGLVNLVDVSPESTGSLLVKDCSHEAHHTFFKEVSKLSPEQQSTYGDHYVFSKKEVGYWDAFQASRVSGGAGSLFLWDSRAVHANSFPKKVSAFRHVVYTCYQPASMATEADLSKKRQAYEDYCLTTHWPAMNVRLYEREKAVGYYGIDASTDLPEYSLRRTRDLVEDRRLLQLAGMEPYNANETCCSEPLLQLSAEALMRSHAKCL